MGKFGKWLSQPEYLWSRAEILLPAARCPVPREGGIYGWFFRSIPDNVPTDGSLQHGNLTLLYPWNLSAGPIRKWPFPQQPDALPQDPVPHAWERVRVNPAAHARMSAAGKTGNRTAARRKRQSDDFHNTRRGKTVRLVGRKCLRLLVCPSTPMGTRGGTDPDNSAATQPPGELYPPVPSGVVRNPPQGKGEGPVASCCYKVGQEAHFQGIQLHRRGHNLVTGTVTGRSEGT